jgi:spore maturation protein CgeB
LCKSLIEAGLGGGLKLWGHDHWADSNWTNGIDLSPHYMGREKEQNMPKIYHNSKIVLNSWVNGGWPSGKQKCGYPTVGYYNWRYFEIMGSGSFQLCEWQESMKEWPYESGKHLQTWKTHDELVEKAKYYLEHEEERREIAKNGYELTHSKFVFEKNLEEIFGKVKNV